MVSLTLLPYSFSSLARANLLPGDLVLGVTNIRFMPFLNLGWLDCPPTPPVIPLLAGPSSLLADLASLYQGIGVCNYMLICSFPTPSDLSIDLNVFVRRTLFLLSQQIRLCGSLWQVAFSNLTVQCFAIVRRSLVKNSLGVCMGMRLST